MRLIINADDFGFSKGVTDGILRCHREGVLTSTTLMTTMPDRDRAIDLAGDMPTLGVGIHLCLTQGVPLTKCGRILGRDGRFLRNLPGLFWRLRTEAARREAEEELAAQIAYATTRGLRPTHVDSHKHVCHWPALHGALIGACGTMGVKWVRTAREARFAGMPGPAPSYRMLARYGRKLAGKLGAAGLGTTDWFVGLATTGRTGVGVYEALAKSELKGLGELMVHPGYIEGLTKAETRLLKTRELEMEALCDRRTRAALEGAGVKLARYGEGC